MRCPCCPNRPGLPVVRLISRQDNLLAAEGVDMLNGTLVLDIKPYMPDFDACAKARRLV